jgi:hypothetical protein
MAPSVTARVITLGQGNTHDGTRGTGTNNSSGGTKVESSVEECGVLLPDPDDRTLDLFPLELALRKLNMSERTFQRLVRDGLIQKVSHAGKIYIQQRAITSYFARLVNAAEVERVSRERGQDPPGARRRLSA